MTTEQLEAYLNGDLCAERAQDFEEALRHDRNLREAYLSQLEMDATLRVLLSAGGEEGLTAPEFTESVMARLRSEGAAEGTDRRFAKSVLTEILEDREGIRPIRPLRWPDLVIAIGLLFLFLRSAIRVLRRAWQELHPNLLQN